MIEERTSGSYILYVWLIMNEVFDNLLYMYCTHPILKCARGITKVQDTFRRGSGGYPSVPASPKVGGQGGVTRS